MAGKIDSIPLYRILDVTVERTLLQRMFGLSTVVVNAYDVSTGGVARLVNVIDGMNVRRLLMRVVSEQEAVLVCVHVNTWMLTA